MKDVIKQVLARRAKRQPRTKDEKEARDSFTRGFGAMDEYLTALSTRAGWAAHVGLPAVGIANKSIVNHELGDDRGLVRQRCLEAVYDGYELARALTGLGGDGAGKAFARNADASRFETRATKSGKLLAAGPLAETADTILAAYLEGLPEEILPQVTASLRTAFAAGILLHQHEQGSDHAHFTSLKPKTTKKTPEAPARTAPANDKLLDAVLASPDDDEPRLVLADWLVEQGDPRGELIGIQCALGRAVIGAGGKYVSRTGRNQHVSEEELHEREKELLKRHEGDWLKPIRKYIRQWGWRRGFPSEIITDVGLFIEGLPALSRVPLESFKLTGLKKTHHAALLKAKAHPTASKIDFSRNRVGDPQLLGSQLFAQARSLDLWGNEALGDEGVSGLAEIPFPRLERLRLSWTGITGAAVKTLSRAPFFKRLTYLTLSNNERLGGEAVAPLAKATSLEWLDIGNRSFDDDAAVRLAATSLPRLRVLELSHVVTERGITAIARSEKLGALRHLHWFGERSKKLDKLLTERFEENRARNEW
jgi:uncharacterized protein (TIGR02996 family)